MNHSSIDTAGQVVGWHQRLEFCLVVGISFMYPWSEHPAFHQRSRQGGHETREGGTDADGRTGGGNERE